MKECCVRYLRVSLDLLVEWAEGMQTDDFIGPESYLEGMRHQRDLCKAIVSGEPCPWHEMVPENYLRVMRLMGGSDGL